MNTKKFVIRQKSSKELKIDQYITIFEYFTKNNSSQVSLVTAKLDGPHSRRLNKRSDKLYFMLSGKAELTVVDENYSLEKGDAALIPANTWHSIIGHNAYFVIVTSPPFDPSDEIMA